MESMRVRIHVHIAAIHSFVLPINEYFFIAMEPAKFPRITPCKIDSVKIHSCGRFLPRNTRTAMADTLEAVSFVHCSLRLAIRRHMYRICTAIYVATEHVLRLRTCSTTRWWYTGAAFSQATFRSDVRLGAIHSSRWDFFVTFLFSIHRIEKSCIFCYLPCTCTTDVRTSACSEQYFHALFIMMIK